MKFKINTLFSMVVSAGLLTTAGSVSAQSLGGAYVAGDLLVGFTVGSGLSPDLIANLGPAQTALVGGNHWDLSSLLSGINSGSLVGLSWGVVGVSNAPNRVYSTCASTPPDVANLTLFNSVKTSLVGLGRDLDGTTGSGMPGAGTITNWYNQTIVANTGSFRAVYDNPNTSASGPGTIAFYSGVQSSTVVQVGSFTLSSAGVLTFNTNSVVVVPPPPQITQITRVGNVSTVFFTTTNGSFTYSLHYTNSAGLKAPRSTWPASATTVTGNGATDSISDTTTDSNRIYSVGVH